MIELSCNREPLVIRVPVLACSTLLKIMTSFACLKRILSGVIVLFTNVASVWACTTFGGAVVWNDNGSIIYSFTQSGTTLTSGSLGNTACGTLFLSLGRPRFVNTSGSLEFWTAGACNTFGQQVSTWTYKFTAAVADWSTACDRVDLHWVGYYDDGSTFGSGTLRAFTYPENETSNTSQYSAPDDWVEASYLWKATVTTNAAGRHFNGRPFYEADNTQSPNDTCWFAGIDPSYRYDQLNKSSGGPFPNQTNWGNLDPNESWDDKVGWGPLNWVTYYRQNSPNIVNGGNNGSCSATVGQRMLLVADWGGGVWTSRAYKDNTHTITIWNSNISNYNTGSSTHWTIQSQRNSDVTAKYKVWPILEPPTTIGVTAVSSTTVNLGWGGASGDFNEYRIWRRPAGGTRIQLNYTGNTLYEDSTVAANSDYYYCITTARSDISPVDNTTPMHTEGPCSSEVRALTYPQPTSLTLSKSTVHRSINECYTLTAGNGANMTLDLEYTLNSTPQQPTLGWPSLDGNGQSEPICTTAGVTPLGTYVFTGIRNTLNAGMPWVTVNAQITVVE